MFGVKRVLASAGMTAALVLSLPGGAQAADTWHEVKLPFLWPTAYVNDLTATAPDNVWMGGVQGFYCIPAPVGCYTRSDGNAVVRRWDGSKWLEYPLQGIQGGTGGIGQIEAYGSQVWAVGPGQQMRRFDGSAFQQVTAPEGYDHLDLTVGPAGVWAGMGRDGDAKVEQYRWSGSAWIATPAPAGTDSLSGLTSRAADEAWAHDSDSLLRWDGAGWSVAAALPSAGNSVLRQVQAAGPGEVWAAFLRDGGAEPARVFRFKNGAWTEFTPSISSPAWTLSVDGLGAVWAVAGGGKALMKFDGTAWQQQPMPSGVAFSDLTGVPGTDDLWAITRKDIGGPYVYSTN